MINLPLVIMQPTLEPTAIIMVTTPTVQPAAEASMEVLRMEKARISHYWPPLGSVNCANFRNGVCVSHTASGQPWENWVGSGAACPREWPFYTKFKTPDGKTWTCVDRGGKIIYGADGLAWIDLLVEHAPVPYGSVMEIEVLK